MDLQVSDVGPGTTVISEGYADNSEAVAAYDRTLSPPAASPLVLVDSEVMLADSVGTAAANYSATVGALRSRRTRRTLGRLIARSVGARAHGVRVGPPRRVTALPSGRAVTLRISATAGGVPIGVAVAFGQVDRVVSELVVAGIGRRAAMRAARRYLRPLTEHIVAGLSPVSTAAPAISAAAVRGGTLQATTGSWDVATKPTSYGYQWQRCDSAGSECTPIPGAQQASYLVTDADAGATLRVSVIASNSAGESTAVSAPSPPIP
jgi:hypothetical protein